MCEMSQVGNFQGNEEQQTWPPENIKWYYADHSVCIAHGDCREIVPRLGRFDLLLTDPPYGINYRQGKGEGRNPKWRKKHIDVPIYGDDKPFDGSTLPFQDISIVWGGNHFASSLPNQRSWLIWDKRVDMLSNDMGDCEIAWSNLGCVSRIFRHRWSGVIRDSENGETVLHPTQKPLELMRWCIQLADKSNGGPVQTILDAYAGSCTTGRAAKDLGRKCVCIEMNERYAEIGAKRMAQEVFDFGPENSRK